MLEMNKTVMEELWYDYVKLKYGKTQNYVTWMQTALQSTQKTDDIYVEITKDVETRFDTTNSELEKPLPKEKIKILSD